MAFTKIRPLLDNTTSQHYPPADLVNSPLVKPPTPKPLNLNLTSDIEPGEVEWIIDYLFEKGRLHMICAPTRSGITEFLLRLISDWSYGFDVLGHPSHSAPFMFIDGARDTKSVKLSLRALEIDPSQFRFLSGLDMKQNIMTMLLQHTPKDCEVVFISNLLVMLGYIRTDNSNGFSDVLLTLRNIREWSHATNRTVIIDHPMVKTELGAKYGSLVSKISGPNILPQAVETILLIDDEDHKDPANPYRRVEVSSHNKYVRDNALQGTRFRFDENARLTPAQALPLDANNKPALILDSLNEPCSMKDIASLTGIPLSSVYRHISELEKLKLVKRTMGKLFIRV